MSWRPIGVPLYLRLWLAVLAAVAVITIAFGWWWRINASERERERPARQIVIRSEAGDVLGQSMSKPERIPGVGVEFDVQMKDGSTVSVQIPWGRRRGAGEGGPPPPRPWWMLRPYRGWLDLFGLGLIALAVAIGTYPIVRRLTQRLERVSRGVERWGEGDLAARVPEDGADEVSMLARRFNHAAERVQQLLQSHKSLLANASHELRSPLTRICMGLELMGERPSEASREEINRNIGELDQLIDEILLASRLDARESDLGTVEPVDLSGLCAEECARSGASLEVDAGGRQVVVPGVVKLLRRVVRNLLENARRYSSGSVEVTVREEGAQAVLSVRDHGPGVPAESRERIFEPFYRLPGASEQSGGVGLGLALVRSIVERHGGTVRCEAAPGGGACFVVRLPSSA